MVWFGFLVVRSSVTARVHSFGLFTKRLVSWALMLTRIPVRSRCILLVGMTK